MHYYLHSFEDLPVYINNLSKSGKDGGIHGDFLILHYIADYLQKNLYIFNIQSPAHSFYTNPELTTTLYLAFFKLSDKTYYFFPLLSNIQNNTTIDSHMVPRLHTNHTSLSTSNTASAILLDSTTKLDKILQTQNLQRTVDFKFYLGDCFFDSIQYLKHSTISSIQIRQNESKCYNRHIKIMILNL